MNSFSTQQFDQLSQGLQTAASNVDVAQSMFFVNPVTSLIAVLMSYLGSVMIFLIPALWLAQALISYVPIVQYAVGAVSGGHGSMGGDGSSSPFSGAMKMILGVLLATLAATGAWMTVVSWEVAGIEAAANQITQANIFSGGNTPAAIKQYKGLVDVYDNNEAATQYQTMLNKEGSLAAKMQHYYAQYSPEDNDPGWQKQKSEYTAVVCKAQILANKLNNSDYGAKIGSDNPDQFKQHLSQTKASDQATAPFKPSFISSSMEQAYGVELPSSSNQ